MPTETQVLAAAVESNAGLAQSIALGLTRSQFNWCPQPGQWSIAQAIAHLNLVNGQDLVPLQRAIEHGGSRNLTGEGPFTYGLLSRKFVESMEPPVKRKFKAPATYQPPEEADLTETLTEYERVCNELCKLARASAGLHLGRVKTTLPMLPPFLRTIVKMPLGARFALIAAHDRRHLWQAGQVRNHPAFPQ